METREATVLRSVFEMTWKFYLWIAVLIAVLAWGLHAYIEQLRLGLVVTGLRDQFSWGLYITNFVFFIGISHAGTLISAILRVTDAGWRRPITRMAEAITVVALCTGAPMVLIDLGRPDRILNLLRYGRIQSPIIWDVLSITTYLAGCILYFYIPMIPDLALLAKQPNISAWRRWLYSRLAMGWTGTDNQKAILERSISVMAIIIIPLAVSVHTVVSWIFAMTLRPGWDSSIFGPYFVIGAIYSGAATVVFSMWVLRKLFRFEDYIETRHFRNLGLLLLSFALIYLYFNINEYLTVGYKLEGRERELLNGLFTGEFAGAFWIVQSTGVFIPILLMLTVLGWKRYQHFVVPGVTLASALVIIGAWAKRYLIVIPTLQTPFLPSQHLPWEWTHYRPTWVEWSITAAAVAGFLLIYTLLLKVFPIISIWETRHAGDTQTAGEPAPAALKWWRPGTTMPALILLLFFGASINASANADSRKSVKQATISLDWKELPTEKRESQQQQPGSSFIYVHSGRLLSLFRRSEALDAEELIHAFQLVATLREANGNSIAYKPVEFSLKTRFGALVLGSRPTMNDGRAQLVVKDRRFGEYPVEVKFAGDKEYAPVSYEARVAFPPRPGPSLPNEGILITPYASSSVALPFLLFYGLMWAVFIYAFGYLIAYRLRKPERASRHCE